MKLYVYVPKNDLTSIKNMDYYPIAHNMNYLENSTGENIFINIMMHTKNMQVYV